MKASEIRSMTSEEKQLKLNEAKETLFNLRFQLAGGQLENTSGIQHTKREIARLKTIIRESEMAQQGKR